MDGLLAVADTEQRLIHGTWECGNFYRIELSRIWQKVS